MKLSVISFTDRGIELSEKIQDSFSRQLDITLYTKHKRYAQLKGLVDEKSDYKKATNNPIHIEKQGKEASSLNSILYVEESLTQWTQEQFQHHHALVFIGACGIAVRAIAPYVKDKLKDSPVLVIDEGGSFIIPILSGHYGGGNELAKAIAERIGAIPVITTATDVNGLFAVDVFARKNHLVICNREGIESISSAILAREEVTMAIHSDLIHYPKQKQEEQKQAKLYQGEQLYQSMLQYWDLLPRELTFVPYSLLNHVSILISPYDADRGKADLLLCPKVYVIGIGCRRGKSFEEIEGLVKRQIEQAGIMWEAVLGIASIDRKQDEEGLLEFSKRYELPFYTFTSEALMSVEGKFISSTFVEEQVGVGNVCERAAMAVCGESGKLVMEKAAENGITVAIAEKRWSVIFDEV